MLVLVLSHGAGAGAVPTALVLCPRCWFCAHGAGAVPTALVLCPRRWCCAYGPGTVSTTVPDASGAPAMWSATACHAARNCASPVDT